MLDIATHATSKSHLKLESALASIWCYSWYIESAQELPPELRSPDPYLREQLHHGQVTEVARGAVMHCTRVGGDALTFAVFTRTLDSIREISDRLSADSLDADPDIQKYCPRGRRPHRVDAAKSSLLSSSRYFRGLAFVFTADLRHAQHPRARRPREGKYACGSA